MKIGVIAFKIHPEYQKVPKNNIAVLKTKRITELQFVPICLTDDLTPLLGRSGRILTWTSDDNEDERRLLGTEVTVIHSDDCKKDFGAVPRHSFCARHGYRDTYVCNGDSGGGFMIKHKLDNRWFLRGVVSEGTIDRDGDCTVGDNVVFTDVSNFVNFLMNAY